METRSGSSFGRSLFLIILFFSVLIAFGAATLLTVRAQSGGLSSMSVVYKDGRALERYIINSPPRPPASFNSASTLYKAPEPGAFSSSKTLSVPAYDWVFGCSSVSGAMIAGYYDLNGYPNLYTGPANGGNAPMNNSTSVWPVWSDGSTTYPNLPLAASHKDVDGRGAAVKGSIDDYWVAYGSTASDPYTTGGWTQHSWSDGFAIGDYMKTSQKLWVDPSDSTYIINTDGSTSFFNYGNGTRYQCSQMATDGVPYSYDGTLGRKQFYEARGYTVTDCYNQVTDNKSTGGFTYAQYKAEIDAGRPVMLNLYTDTVGGHTVVGVGYDDTVTNSIIIHDTWILGDWVHFTHSMNWGGSYSGMLLSSVSIVNLAPLTPPAAFNKTSPANASNALPSLTLRWGASAGATAYRYCLDADTDTTCNTGWHDVGLNTSVALTGQALGPHSWQVQATNGSGTTDANTNTWWTFTVVASQKIFLPFINKQLPPPGAFNKISPTNGIGGQSNNPTLSWGASSGVSSYEYCIDKTNDNTCNGSGGANGTTTWTSASANTSVGLSGLSLDTTYYWQVRASNPSGYAYANGGAWWSFTTGAASWTTIMTEDFEGAFPGSKWTLYGYNNYSWGQRNCRAYAGSNSGWGVGGWSSGASLGCGSKYPQDSNSWMVYGPFDLTGATAADLSFKYWTHNGTVGPDANTNDTLCAMASVDDDSYSGWCWWGDNAWSSGTLDLGNVFTLGNLLGRSQVWVAFIFSTDLDVNTYTEGSYVDNITLRKCTFASCPAGSSLNGSTNGGNKAPVQFKRPK